MTARAFRPQRSVAEIVASVRGIHTWIDDEIAKGRTDEEIVAQAPVAIAFINGDLSLGELERAVATLAGPSVAATSAPPSSLLRHDDDGSSEDREGDDRAQC